MNTVGPIVSALDAVRERRGPAAVHGVTSSLIVADAGGWLPATRLTDGSAIDEFLAAAQRRWPSEPHVAAGLAWKSYAYGATLPVALGYATARLIPNTSADNVLVRVPGHDPFIQFGLVRPSLVETVSMRATLLDGHLGPIIEHLHDRLRVGRRTLLGSVASAVCHALLRASDILPGPAVSDAYEILEALDLADLVDFGPDAEGRLTVSRRTCCLGFLLPVPRVCTGCCITPTSLPK